MRLIFMGSPEFAVPALRALHDAGHEIAAVYSQPPRPAGRGQNLRLQPVHQAAEELGLMVRTPRRLRTNAEEHEFFASLGADAAIVAAYGLILPPALLEAPRLGCLNIHASLLPRWRGAAPIQAAILHGDARSGVSIMQMDAGLDTGDVLAEAAIDLAPDMTAQQLHDALAPMGAKLLLDVLDNPRAATPQPEYGMTYAARLTRENGAIDWTRPAIEIDRQIRGLTPWPGTYTSLDGTVLKIGSATLEAHSGNQGPAGHTLDDRLLIACGEGAVRITMLQRPGRGMMDAGSFLRGQKIDKDVVLGS